MTILTLTTLCSPEHRKIYTFFSTRSCRQLRRRLFLVEKLKDANTVGLVVGSVGVDQHKEAVQRMRQLCKAAGKKIYVISVGKINVPKLSNFSSDIDVFVLLSCPFGVLLDSGDYYRPVLSFFEAEIALNPSKSHWAADSGWRADFGRHLQDQIATHSNPEVQEGDVSLISGKVRARPEIIQNGEGPEAQKTTVALYSAGDYFAERSWKGLDDTAATVTQSTVVEEGRRGIAQGYQGK
ncbi:unnamed protein product [Caenorhabditis angaria]|uniref:2-(3-amino-3-carboxypropyl)histidine synthase subunit 2 n=1 Tax=Caenorhabditis angaria TaxID=860376 RepID=A0A9P1MXT5_9PELO|nr:unnamed protein product [Caenorhabditis angaria]